MTGEPARDYFDARLEAIADTVEAAIRTIERTIDAQREHVAQIFTEHREAHQMQHQQTEKALLQAQQVMETRLGTLNELRSEVVEDRAQYVKREVWEEKSSSLEQQMAQRDERIAAIERGIGERSAVAAELLPQFREGQARQQDFERRVAALETSGASEEAVENLRKSFVDERQSMRRQRHTFFYAIAATVFVGILNFIWNAIQSVNGGTP